MGFAKRKFTEDDVSDSDVMEQVMREIIDEEYKEKNKRIERFIEAQLKEYTTIKPPYTYGKFRRHSIRLCSTLDCYNNIGMFNIPTVEHFNVDYWLTQKGKQIGIKFSEYK